MRNFWITVFVQAQAFCFLCVLCIPKQSWLPLVSSSVQMGARVGGWPGYFLSTFIPWCFRQPGIGGGCQASWLTLFAKPVGQQLMVSDTAAVAHPSPTSMPQVTGVVMGKSSCPDPLRLVWILLPLTLIAIQPFCLLS